MFWQHRGAHAKTKMVSKRAVLADIQESNAFGYSWAASGVGLWVGGKNCDPAGLLQSPKPPNPENTKKYKIPHAGLGPQNTNQPKKIRKLHFWGHFVYSFGRIFGAQLLEKIPPTRVHTILPILFRSFEKGLAGRGGWREEILPMPEIQASFLCPFFLCHP